MTKEQLKKEKVALGLSTNYNQLVTTTQQQWNAANPTNPFSVPTRSELTIIGIDEFPLNKVHKGISTGLTRLMPTKNPKAKSTHYPQIAVSFESGVKFLLGADVPENTEMYFETKEAMIKNELGELIPFEIDGQQVYNLAPCAKDKFDTTSAASESSATTIEKPKGKKATA